MKLLAKSSINSFIFLFVAMALGAVFIYWEISKEVKGEIDEELLNRKLEIIKSIKDRPNISLNPDVHTDFEIQEISDVKFYASTDYYEDIEIYELIEKEEEPHRQLVTKFNYQGKFYSLKIQASLLDLEDLAEIIIISTGWIYLILIFSSFLLNRYFQKRLWEPFYETLNELKRFRVDQDNLLKLVPTSITEFSELNIVVRDLADTSRKRYQQQKQFVENASHEIQTPLAIALHQAEQLIQNPNLEKEDADALLVLNQQLERLAALNKALLLITKINNQQFGEIQEVDLYEVVKKIAEEYSFIAEEKNINVTINIQNVLAIEANIYLIEILVRNLVKNALVHNIPNGYLDILISGNSLEFRNSGTFEGDINNIFQRFVKYNTNSNSLGLGLSIVKSICDIYNYIPYAEAINNEFKIRIDFKAITI